MRHTRKIILMVLVVFLISSVVGKTFGQTTYQEVEKPVERVMRFKVMKFKKPNKWELVSDASWCPFYRNKAEKAKIDFFTEYGVYTGVFLQDQAVRVCDNAVHLIGDPGGELPKMTKLGEEEAEKSWYKLWKRNK